MGKKAPPHDEFLKKTILKNAELEDLLDTSKIKAFRVENISGVLQTHLIFPFEHPKGTLFHRITLREGEDIRKEVENGLRWSNMKIDGFFRETQTPQKILYEQISKKALYEDSTHMEDEGVDLLGYINDKLNEEGYDEFKFIEDIIQAESITEKIKSETDNK